MPGTTPSLAEFAKEHAGHHAATPWFETLPTEIQDEVIAGWHAGIRGTPILEWLRACGIEGVTKSKLNNYMTSDKGRRRLEALDG